MSDVERPEINPEIDGEVALAIEERYVSASYTKRIAVLAAVCTAIGMLILIGASYYVIHSRVATARKICRATVASNTSLRRVLIAARNEQLRTAGSPDQAVRITQFYSLLLRPVPPLRCDKHGTPQRLPEPSTKKTK